MNEIAPASPGSLTEFCEQRGIDMTDQEAVQVYYDALATYRQQLAVGQGLTPEELHTRAFPAQRQEMVEA